jgi:FolB domain-containing protein
MMKRDYQKTSLHDIEVEVRLGIDAWERAGGKKQKVLVDIDLYRFQREFKGKSIKDCLNYHTPFERVTKGWAKRPHTDLLETLVEELVTFCLKDKTVDAVRVTVRKPHVYNGRATPSVEFFRHRVKPK